MISLVVGTMERLWVETLSSVGLVWMFGWFWSSVLDFLALSSSPIIDTEGIVVNVSNGEFLNMLDASLFSSEVGRFSNSRQASVALALARVSAMATTATGHGYSLPDK